ncbi:MAG: hypothetical protein J6Y30_11845 [Treponema sp.]|nr:hypothetical protein [Treponema sp.]
MLCAKYDYKMDIAVKQEEAFEDGMEKGIEQKAIDTATNLLKMNIVSHEQIAEATGLPIEKINELAKAPSVFP